MVRVQKVVLDWVTEVQHICSLERKTTRLAKISSYAFSIIVTVIWRERNKIKFNQRRLETNKVLKENLEQLLIRGSIRGRWKVVLMQEFGFNLYN